MQQHYTGAASEALAAAHYLGRGEDVFLPFMTQSRADILILRDGEPVKVQVKTATWGGNGTGPNQYLQVRLANRTAGAGLLYKEGDFDLLFIIDPEGRKWEIPWNELPATKSLCLDRRGLTVRTRGGDLDRFRV